MPLFELAPARDGRKPLYQYHFAQRVVQQLNLGSALVLLCDNRMHFCDDLHHRLKDHHSEVVFFEYNEANTQPIIEDEILPNLELLGDRRITVINNDVNGWHTASQYHVKVDFAFFPKFFHDPQLCPPEPFFPDPLTTSRDFINLSFKVRPAKSLMAVMLEKMELLESNYVSLNSNVLYRDETVEEQIQHAMRSHWAREYSKQLCNRVSKIANRLQSKLPLELDIDFSDSNQYRRTSINSPTLDPYYNDSWFDIVVEDAVPQFDRDDDVVIFTEKTAKSLARKRPFLLFGKPGQLAALREIGFKTFEPFFREEYDRVTHHVYRAQQIAREAKRLCDLDKKEKHQLWLELNEIVEYNFKLIKTMKPVLYQQPIKDFSC